MMDDIEDDGASVTPYTGLVIQFNNVHQTLNTISENIDKFGCVIDLNLSMGLLEKYLDICDTIPFSSSSSILCDTVKALVRHAFAMPADFHDEEWAERISNKLRSTDRPVNYCDKFVCESGISHHSDNLWYIYTVGDQLYYIDYFCRSSSRPILIGNGTTSSVYERCVCGRWHRSVTILETNRTIAG